MHVYVSIQMFIDQQHHIHIGKAHTGKMIKRRTDANQIVQKAVYVQAKPRSCTHEMT